MTRCLIFLFLLSLSAGAAKPEDPGARQILNQKYHNLVQGRCYECHGQDDEKNGHFNSILEGDELVQKGIFTPGDAANSKLYKSVLSGKMPKESSPLTPAELKIIKDWIDAQPKKVSKKITCADTSKEVSTQVSDQLAAEKDSTAQQNTRFISLKHLKEQGLTAVQIESIKAALSKTLNSLSSAKDIKNPIAVPGSDGLLLKIDLRDYGWDAQKWEVLSRANPNPWKNSIGSPAQKEAFRKLTGSGEPVMKADALISTAIRAATYTKLLSLPDTVKGLERKLKVDSTAPVGAGFVQSGVSANNRVFLRMDSENGAYWRSDDFKDSKNIHDVMTHPLNYQRDGGEVIFKLPNGLLGFALYNANGQSVTRAPIEIVSDPGRPDRQIENGISCLSCHAQGYIPKGDEIAAYVRTHSTLFSPKDIESIEARYDDRAQATRMKEDQNTFTQNLQKTHPLNLKKDTIKEVIFDYESPLTLAKAAAELGVDAQLLSEIFKDNRKFLSLASLADAGATITRDNFNELYRDAAAIVNAFQEKCLQSGSQESSDTPNPEVH